MKAQDIKAGTTFTMYQGDKAIGGWTALEDANVVKVANQDIVRVMVKFKDGGVEPRYFDIDTEVPVD